MGHNYSYPTYNPLITAHEPPSMAVSGRDQSLALVYEGQACRMAWLLSG